ncbi:DUF998 domain-containing protein [Kitasatospora sp. NPDC059747]|uniref:DUF998 domain-containing protein n=1 Tax=Kitasatospora sp. NPDC059747 TaxID=3346930 RepID=UPI0036615353
MAGSEPSANPTLHAVGPRRGSARPALGLRQWDGATALLIAGAVLYSAWPLENLVVTGLPPGRSFISELAAEGQPTRSLFAACDAAAGALIAYGCIARLFSSAQHVCWARTFLWLTLLGAGVMTSVCAVLSPMECSPSLEEECETLGFNGLLPSQALTHVALSTLVEAAFLAAMWIAHRLAPTTYRFRRGLPRESFLGVLSCCLLLVDIALSAYESSLHGLVQRAHVAIVAAWLISLAWSTRRQAVEPASR